MIDHKNKLIFIHMEKTGGTSLEHNFGDKKELWGVTNSELIKSKYDNGCIKHVSYDYAKIIYKDYFDNYRKITIIRHPYSLFISKLNWFYFSGNIKKEDVIKIIDNNNTRWKINSLDEFLGNPNNYDFIIRFENFNEDYNKMLKLLDIDNENMELKHINKMSNTDRYKSINLSEEAKEIINKYTEKYCRLFGYNLI